LDSDNDEILVDNGLTLGHLSLDEIEGAYFLKFSMLKILKISKDFYGKEQTDQFLIRKVEISTEMFYINKL
jgi:hypothetical protein